MVESHPPAGHLPPKGWVGGFRLEYISSNNTFLYECICNSEKWTVDTTEINMVPYSSYRKDIMLRHNTKDVSHVRPYHPILDFSIFVVVYLLFNIIHLYLNNGKCLSISTYLNILQLSGRDRHFLRTSKFKLF